MENELSIVCEQLAGAAASGIYQGILVTALVALLLKCAPRTNAATRHAMWFCTLSLVVLLFFVHVGRETIALLKPAPRAAAEEMGTQLPAFSEFAALEPQDEAVAQSGELNSPPQPGRASTSQPATDPVHGTTFMSTGPQTDPLLDAILQGAIPLDTEDPLFIQQIKTGLSILLTPVQLPVKLPGSVSTAIIVSVLAVAFFRAVMLSVQLGRIRKLKKCGQIAPSHLQSLFEKLILQVKRPVELRVLPGLNSPLFLGFLHPVILFPAEHEAEEAEPLLRHELAHLRRRDDWVNLVQQFVQATLPFHPGVWWISRRMTLEREIACDDQVLQANAGRKENALLLATIAGRMRGKALLLAPGASTNKSQLQQRINMILDISRNISPRLARTRLCWMSCAAALIALGAVYAAPRISPAHDETIAFALPAEASLSDFGPPQEGTDPLQASPSVDAVAELPAPPGIGPGPKVKQTAEYRVYGQPVVVPAPPAPAIAPIPSGAALPPVPLSADVVPVPRVPMITAIEPPTTPGAPPAVRAPRATNRDELEERLDRLEKMVQSLLARERAGQNQPYSLEKPPVKHEANTFRSYRLNPEEVERIQEQAKRQAERAAEDVKRTIKEAEKLAKSDQKRSGYSDLLKGQRQQLEALRKQLQLLEQQKEKLSHEIERLEKDREKLEQDQKEEQGEIKTESSLRKLLAGQKPAGN